MSTTTEMGTRYGYVMFREEAHHRLLLPIIRSLLPEGASLSILDVGCGTGFVAAALAELGHSVTGIDTAEDGIAIARKAVSGNVRFEVASAYDDWSKLKPERGWDVVTAVEVIEHLYSPQRFLHNAYHALKPGGCIIITTPYHGYMKNLALALLNAWDRHFHVHHEGGHIKFFSRRTLAAMLENSGFTEAKFRYAGRAPGLWKDMICRAKVPS
ncbi:MAG: hypothetical protein KatS3mg117_3244 [Geminicoccaceae bacterium]|nr:MAG: hypothetical protein KatS3mg117_3244 [Geminicoccaceae bacterium]